MRIDEYDKNMEEKKKGQRNVRKEFEMVLKDRKTEKRSTRLNKQSDVE